MINPEKRNAQHFLLGTSLSYEINVPIESLFDFTEGMYCYINEETAIKLTNFWRDLRVLKVLVKKDTKIKYAKSFPDKKSNDVVLVEKLIPISMVPEIKFISKFTKKNTKNNTY